MRIKIINTLKGTEAGKTTVWQAGEILDDSVSPFPRVVANEARRRSNNVEVLPDVVSSMPELPEEPEVAITGDDAAAEILSDLAQEEETEDAPTDKPKRVSRQVAEAK